MSYIRKSDLKVFCEQALLKEGMSDENASLVAFVLSETDAYGIHSHGTKNLHNYIRKYRVGGMDIQAEPAVVIKSDAFAVIDAQNALGMIPSVKAMTLASEQAEKCGISLVTVKNSNHFGAAGVYANIAAKSGLIGLVCSNVDPNMTVPGARGMVIGNNPIAFALPAQTMPSIFLDIALSNVASLKVVQARQEGNEVPNTWIVDKDGLPTTDPSHYPEEGAMQPMAAHKGYGLSILVEVLTGMLSGSATSVEGDIVSWIFELDQPNNVSHTFIAIDPKRFGVTDIASRAQRLVECLWQAPKARGSERIYVPGEIEWERYKKANQDGIALPEDVEVSLKGLADELMINLPLYT
ncbi:MAG: Ldh family oxidoreductase [Clostridiaceae bacterium]|nr:Ldh family oxidoreductase [Clostridiaceae bacterium]